MRASELMEKAWIDIEKLLPNGEGKKNFEILSKYVIER
jgi:hypothetical protein